MDVLSKEYAARLSEQTAWWKRLFDVQAPYRWNLKRLRPLRTLDIGCGIGRNLTYLDGLGVDPNPACIEIARARGLDACLPQDLMAEPESFDTLLFAHVLEHMTMNEAVQLVRDYLGYLKPGGKVICITPQELGHDNDSTHVEFRDFANLSRIADQCDLAPLSHYSFPFPRAFGTFFKYNEFVAIYTRKASSSPR